MSKCLLQVELNKLNGIHAELNSFLENNPDVPEYEQLCEVQKLRGKMMAEIIKMLNKKK